MLQLSAPSSTAARNKIASLPSGSWGVVKIANEQRRMAFSICGDDVQTYNFSETSFAKNYNAGMAAALKQHAAKPPVDKEEQRKKYLQQYNNINHTLDQPTTPVSADSVPDDRVERGQP